jgi:prostaglandin-E synthase 1
MSALISTPAFHLYAMSSAALVVLLYGLGFLTGKTRELRKAVLNPEDVRVYRGAAVVDVEHPDVQRIKRAHANLIENAVPFFVIGFLYVLTDPSILVARALLLAFVAFRFLHALFYLTGRQPFRAGSFAVGAFINLIMVVQVVRAVV